MALAPAAGPVLVAGAGCAGLVAALAAARRGVEVVIFDIVDPLAAAADEEGNTARSTGLIPAAGTRLQLAAGVSGDSPELQARDIAAANGVPGPAYPGPASGSRRWRPARAATND